MKLVVHPNPILRSHAVPVERIGKHMRHRTHLFGSMTVRENYRGAR